MSKTEIAHKSRQEQQEKDKRKYRSEYALSDIMLCKECVADKIKILRLTKGFDVARFI